MWKSFLTFCRRIRGRMPHVTGVKYLKKDKSTQNTTIRWCAQDQAKKQGGGPPHSAQFSGLGVRAPDAFPFWAISTSAPRFRAFPELAGVFLRALRARPSQGVNPAPSGEIAFAFLRFSQRLRAAVKRKFQGGRRLAEVELLADLMHCHAVGVAGGGFADSLDRFEIGLAAEGEGLVVDGQEEFRAGVLGHLPGLLGVAVGADPRIVGAHGHDGEAEGA